MDPGEEGETLISTAFVIWGTNFQGKPVKEAENN